MESVLLINQIIVILIVSTSFWLGSWVYFADRRSRLNQMFFLMMVFFALWIIFGFLGGMVLKNLYLATLATRVNFGVISLFLFATYFFSLYFPKEGKRYPVLDKMTILVWSVLAFLSFFTGFIIKDSEVKAYGNEIIWGQGGDIFLLAVVFGTILIFFNLFKKYFTLSQKEKIKIQYLIIGLSLCAAFNLIFNVVLPLITGKTEYYQFGDYSVVFFIIFTGLAIGKKELFGVKVILIDLLVSLIGIILFVFPFLQTGLVLKVVGWGVFFSFCITGYLLIRYTHREIKQKEILEEKVKERTEELETGKAELEKFYRLTVGRELRMVELKQKIKELEEKIKK